MVNRESALNDYAAFAGLDCALAGAVKLPASARKMSPPKNADNR